jgi:hypothetical protein
VALKPTTVTISGDDIAFLEKRGARSHRGGGEFSRSVVLGRMLDTWQSVLKLHDPRTTRALPEAIHQLVLQALPEPWKLKQFEIEHLEIVLAGLPGFDAAARAAGLDPAEVVAALAQLEFVEKVVLADHATLAQAPAISEAMQEDE